MLNAVSVRIDRLKARLNSDPEEFYNIESLESISRDENDNPSKLKHYNNNNNKNNNNNNNNNNAAAAAKVEIEIEAELSSGKEEPLLSVTETERSATPVLSPRRSSSRSFGVANNNIETSTFSPVPGVSGFDTKQSKRFSSHQEDYHLDSSCSTTTTDSRGNTSDKNSLAKNPKGPLSIFRRNRGNPKQKKRDADKNHKNNHRNKHRIDENYLNMATMNPPSQPSWANTSSKPPYQGNGSGGFSNSTTTAVATSIPVTNGSLPPAAIANANGGPPPPGVPDSYFTESRKGEVNELRQVLRNFTVERDPLRKREIIKKVIAYMTLGIDVSRLFTEMMLAIETRDLVIKKMVYLFLINYATANPDLAQMCTNTLQKDCGNEDPMVRGLALRALCSINIPQMAEYISEPLRRSLTDPHAYVRKTGVMGMLKMFHLDRPAFENSNFVDILYDMLKDPDAAVVTNCILVLNEVMAKGDNGGMAINRAIMLHLLNRLHEFSEFGVVAVLELVPRYIPANQEEGYQIMNLLDPVLRTSNAGAFMAVIFAFLSLAENVADNNGAGGTTTQELRSQIVTRVKAPLITMMTGGSSELTYTLLKHVDALIELCPGVFDDEYRQFYIRFHEPTCVKYLKVTVLAKLANPSNAPDIVAELAECVADNDAQLSRNSVRAMGWIACRNVGGDGCAESIARRLVDMLLLDIDHVSSEAATALADMLRKHSNLKNVISPSLPRSLKYIKESSGKASIIYLLGECGDVVNEAPYSLEKLIDSYDELKDADVKIALLSSTLKLFFKRPPEVQRMLGRLLAKATEDVSSQDLHDRALLYYRLLRTAPDPNVVKTIIDNDCNIPSSINFSEEEIGDDIRDELMKEFNTLSIMYGNTSENFIAEEYQVKFVRMPPEHPLDDGAAPAEDLAVNVLSDQMEQTSIGTGTDIAAPPPAAAAPTPAPTPAAAPEMDLLGFGDDTTTATNPMTAPTPAPTNALTLDPSTTLSGEEYQAKWSSVSDAESHVASIPLRIQPPSTDAVETPLAQHSILTMASGELPTEIKFFLYAQEVGGTLFLVQASITKAPSEIDLLVTIKLCGGTGGNDKALLFIDTIKNALGAFV